MSAVAGLLRASFLYGAAGALGKALALFTVPYLSRALGPIDYGLADLATALAALLTLIVNFSGDVPAIRLHAHAATTDRRRRLIGTYVLLTIIVSTGAGALLLPLSPAIAGGIWGVPNATPLVALAILLVPLSASQVALAAIQRIHARPRSFALLSVIDLMAQLLFAVLFVALGAGPIGVVLGFVVGSTAGLVAAAYVGRHYIDLRPLWADGWRMLRMGGQFLPAVVAFVLADNVSRAVAANGLSVADVGHMAVAIRLSSVMSLATAAFSMAWGPYALTLERTTDTARLFGRVITDFCVVVVVVTIGLGAVAPEVATIVSGSAFRPAGEAMPGMVFAAGLIGGLYLLATAAGMADRAGLIALPTVIGGLVQIGMVAVSVPTLGLVGVGLAAASGPLLSVIILAGRVRESISASWPTVASLIALGAAAAALLGFANAEPDAWWSVRVSVSLLAIGAGSSLLWRRRPNRAVATR